MLDGKREEMEERVAGKTLLYISHDAAGMFEWIGKVLHLSLWVHYPHEGLHEKSPFWLEQRGFSGPGTRWRRTKFANAEHKTSLLQHQLMKHCASSNSGDGNTTRTSLSLSPWLDPSGSRLLWRLEFKQSACETQLLRHKEEPVKSEKGRTEDRVFGNESRESLRSAEFLSGNSSNWIALWKRERKIHSLATYAMFLRDCDRRRSQRATDELAMWLTARDSRMEWNSSTFGDPWWSHTHTTGNGILSTRAWDGYVLLLMHHQNIFPSSCFSLQHIDVIPAHLFSLSPVLLPSLFLSLLLLTPIS